MPSKATTSYVCETCQRSFYPSNPHRNASRFCSNACAGEGRRQAPRDRFWQRVDVSGSCWLWRGNIGRDGYGRFIVSQHQRRTTSIAAHRFAYIDTFGSVPDGMFVCHRCDNRACVNPAHLFLGTHQDNMRDMAAKQRAASGASNSMSRGAVSRLSDDDLRSIRHQYATLGVTQSDLARLFGVSSGTIHKIVHGKHWRQK